ncbi:hypothetical protein ES702_04433 [subsurface metagenome]
MNYTNQELNFVTDKRAKLSLSTKKTLRQNNQLLKFGEIVTQSFNWNNKTGTPGFGEGDKLEVANHVVNFLLEAELASNGAEAEYSNMGIPTDFAMLLKEGSFNVHFLNYNPPLELAEIDETYLEADELPRFWVGSYNMDHELSLNFLKAVIKTLNISDKFWTDREFIELVFDQLKLYTYEGSNVIS